MMIVVVAASALPLLMGRTSDPLSVMVLDRTGQLLAPLQEAVAAAEGGGR